MGMVVRTNYGALNATRNMNKNQSGLTNSLEKLSSGFKINRAADDAAGLAISEKMKAQIKSLDTASANCEDGISMIQTTEGYLSEVHDMLNRMVELSEKSANGTYETATDLTGASLDANGGVIYNGTSSLTADGTAGNAVTTGGTDRDALQTEMNQLCSEIDRIASTANFNNVKLFDGDLATKSYYKITSATTTDAYDGTTPADAGLQEAQDDAGTGTGAYQIANLTLVQATGDTATYINGIDSTAAFNYAGAAGQTCAITPEGAGASTMGTGLTLQIGETSNAADKLTVSVMRLNTDSLFAEMCTYTNDDGKNSVCLDVNKTSTVNGITAYTVDISGQDRASAAAEALKGVVNKVSTQRSQLGAMQNRLDHTINNLDTASENITAANSRIRDTDMASEMTKYTQQNVLTQAAQSMLAQANAQPQNVLSLLQ